MAIYNNEFHYKKICAACDKVLLSSDADLTITSIPWLHVTREHPALMAPYKLLWESQFSKKSIQDFIKRFIFYLLSWFRQIFRSLRSNGKYWFASSSAPDNVDFVFVSHLISEEGLMEPKDFYFGDLPLKLSDEGYSVLIILINHTGKFAQDLVFNPKGSPFCRIVLSDSLSALGEGKLFFLIFRAFIRLRFMASKASSKLLKRVINRSSQEAFSGGTRRALRIGFQLEKIASLVRPKVCIVTYEGHSWERIAFSAFRDGYPDTTVVGYQHSALFKFQHALKRKLQSKFNPDHIFAAGKVSQEILIKDISLSGISMSILGSPRFSPAEIHQKKNRNPLFRVACIVLPEGIESECEKLFSFSLKCALKFPEINFIWRLHPSLKFENLLSIYPIFKDLPGNILLSELTLGDDIERADFALYRGSTAIIQAVMAGLIPIYLEIPNEITIDPLFQLETGKRKVTRCNDLKKILEVDVASEIKKLEFKDIQNHCADFYSKLNSLAIKKLLN